MKTLYTFIIVVILLNSCTENPFIPEVEIEEDTSFDTVWVKDTLSFAIMGIPDSVMYGKWFRRDSIGYIDSMNFNQSDSAYEQCLINDSLMSGQWWFKEWRLHLNTTYISNTNDQRGIKYVIRIYRKLAVNEGVVYCEKTMYLKDIISKEIEYLIQKWSR